jgi:hypothetical protein
MHISLLKHVGHTVKGRICGSDDRGGDCKEAKVFEISGRMLSIMNDHPLIP